MQQNPLNSICLEALNTGWPTIVTSIQPICDRVVQLVVRYQGHLPHKAGQFIDIASHNGHMQRYAIADSCPEKRLLSFHIGTRSGHDFSDWVHQQLKTGERLHLRKPSGHCFYQTSHSQQPLLLIATGSGFSSLSGVLQDALKHQHKGLIRLYHGCHAADDLYRVTETTELMEQYSNFFYSPCVSGKQVPAGYTAGRAHLAALAGSPKLQGWRIFLCGHPGMVSQAQKIVLLAGARMNDIHTHRLLVR